MKLIVLFKCSVKVEKAEEKFSGNIEIRMIDSPRVKSFWFMVHFPYSADRAEMMFHTDKDRKDIFAEGIGAGSLGVHPDTKKEMTAYDFSETARNHETLAVAFVVSQIVSEALYRAELEGRERGVKAPFTINFENQWVKEFAPNASVLYHNFIKAFH
jgi:hypothetical protein